ncbi:MAG TPA: DegT/DnrJ/EryC1/StrS family aminotransferase [Gemmatimonadaceae bacterium]|nr:DegT/DnrJ/EryC1/StrS family aminotransferase [Gemmatimonadaceae bacterium]
MAAFIPVNEPVLDGNERKYLNECIDTGWISSEGPFIKEFESRFAKRVGRKHGIAVCNGSAALDAAVAALRIGPGDEVILPTFTIISCAAAISRLGATPVVIDCDPATWNMNVSDIEARITGKTRAIMVVHIYGLPVDMDPVLDIARRHKLAVIEDAAEMIGQTYRGNPCGSFGEISTFSFYPNKHVTTGEGGMIVTDDDALAERCRELRNLSFRAPRRFVHEELGWNFRMTNMQAALGLAQLERLDEFVARKKRTFARYTELLSGIRGVQLPVATTDYAENINWVYGIVIDDSVGFDADEAMRRLAELGIGTRPFFWPMHEQPVYRNIGLFQNESYPCAERIARMGLYIPSGLALTDAQISRVSAAVRQVFA